MKTSVIAFTALSAFAGVAAAQAQVTVFGVVDLAVQYSDNGGAEPVHSLSQDGIGSSRLGFRGIEDLGGGLRAGFWIEGAFGADSGCGGTTLGSPSGASCAGQSWQRRSTISLLSALGEVRLGRDYTPSFWNLVDFSPFGYNGVGSPAATVSSLGSGALTVVRANNTVGYFLPPLGGIYGQAMVAAGEGTTGAKYIGARVGYRTDSINVAGAYGHTHQTGAMVDAYTFWNVGASYNFGVMTVQGYFGKYEYLNRDEKQGLVGVVVPLGLGTLRGSYIRARGDLGPGGRDLNADQYAVGYVYDLSKRTAVYATYSHLDNKGTSASGAQFSVGNGSLTGFLGGQASKGAQLGIRHSF